MRGQRVSSADGTRVQWSPNGTTIALGLFQYSTLPGQPQIILVDISTGATVEPVNGYITGSASFSPDSNRLLVSSEDGVFTYNLTSGQSVPIPFIPPLEEPRPGVPRLLGFVGDERLLVCVQRGMTLTLSTLDIGRPGHDIRPIVRWTGAAHMYPVIANMPLGYWA